MAYNKLYQAAKDPNALTKEEKEALRVFLLNHCIDESKIGSCRWSAISQHAFEGNIGAVNFLLDLGANSNYAMYGAAKSGNRALVMQLFHAGADLCFATYYAALGGHRSLAED